MSISAGARLGPYDLQSRLGGGGMGEVWKAYDPKLQRTVAIKVLHVRSDGAQTEDAAGRILQEARAASALNHPNICVIYEVGESNGQSFIVMEHVEGKPLSELIPSNGLPLESVIRYGTQIADALAHAHEHGIIHRDLKSANVVMTAESTVKLIDFGIAAPLPDADGMTRTVEASADGPVGTLAYMAPEVLRGEPATAPSDIWSLGVLLYEMASGTPPFTGTTHTQVVSAIATETPSPLPARISPALRTIAQRALAKEIGHRYGTAAEVRAALEALESSVPTQASPADDTSTPPSIAVLPFTNLSADPEQQYFCDGLADEIIADLSHVRSLGVISRSSSKQLKDSGTELRAIASTLKVRYVLDGSVRKAGNAIRVTAQLVDAATDEHLWAEKYSGQLEDVFEIQEQISRRIVDALKMQLSPEEEDKLAERPFTNVQAFECYHRARQELYTFTEEGLDRALELIDAAVGIVGDHELLHAAKGTVYFQSVNAALKSDADLLEKAEACARQVFALNADSAHGLALLGLVRLLQGRRPESVQLLKRALMLDPNHSYAMIELYRVYQTAGAEHPTRSMGERLLRMEPLSPIASCARLSTELMTGHADVVRQEAPGLLRITPEFAYIRWVSAVALIYGEQTAEALRVLEAAPEGRTPTIAGRLCTFLLRALQGDRAGAAEAVGTEFAERAWRVEWWSAWMAECYALNGDHDLAIDWLENAFERGFTHYPYFSTHSRIFRTLDGHQRFQALMGRVRVAWEQFEP